MPTTEQLRAALDGRYVVDHLIGEGGMATVYLARDIRHNRKVALKVLRPDLGAVVGVERFLSEIQVTANLQHPNLLPLFDSGEANGLLFYVMPFVEGESLRARLVREKQLPVDEAIRIATAVAGALDYAHRHGVIHRDLKPENILLHDGQPVVADFGIALAVSNAGGGRITQTGLSLGTPQYMSPEQATGDRVIDARTDVYSLGAMTYEMLTGEAPHVGATSQAIIARVLTEKPRSVRSTRPSVPAHVEAAVEHALEKLAPDRFASAKEFAEAITGQRAVATASQTAALSAAAPAAAPSHVSRVREMVAWGLVLLVGAAAAFAATRKAEAPVPGRFVIDLPDSVAATTTYSISISRDGTRIAVLTLKGSRRSLYVRRLEESVAQEVRGTEDASYFSLSPDGKWLAFLQRGALKTVPVEGGTPQTLTDSADATAIHWGENNQILYVRSGAMWMVSSTGSNPRRVAVTDSTKGSLAFQGPEMLPGGEYAITSVRMAVGGIDSSQISVVSLKTGEVTDLGLRGTRPHYVPGHIVFARLGGVVAAAPFSLRKRQVTGPPDQIVENVLESGAGAVAYGVSANGTLVFQEGATSATQGIYVVDRQGVERQLKVPLQNFKEPRLSPDGKRVAVRIGAGTEDGGLWIYDITAGTLTRLTADSSSIRGEWTRDGANIVYPDHAQSDKERLTMRPWDLSAPPKVLVEGARFSYHEISLGLPHGYAALRRGTTDRQADIYLVHIDSLTAPRPFIQGPANEYAPRVSPNGRVLAYTSNETGSNQIYVTTMPAVGPRTRVSVDGGTEPMWSPDGGTLFFRGPRRMMAATITMQPALTVAKVDSLFVDVYRRYNSYAAYDVFPGAKEFLMMRGPEVHSKLFAIVNWPELVRAKAAGTR